jgi:hypothetical protein
MGLDGCQSADAEEERKAAKQLVKWGAAAIPLLEKSLDSIEEMGQQSEFASGARWLLPAYAEIMGPAARTRLRRMGVNAKLGFLDVALDQSKAISLSITSYVSARRAPMRRFLCRRQQPQDDLDQLIMAWQRDDRQLLEGSLGPRARNALDSLLEGRTWEEFRAALWKGEPIGGVGYHFNTPGQWSQPEGALTDEREHGDASTGGPSVDLDTAFKNSSGDDCGRRRVIFSTSLVSDKSMAHVVGPFFTIYLVDNPDLGALLRLIGSCATQR